MSERAQARSEEIVNACEQLFKTMHYKDINIKEIAEKTTFSRPSIYNYFLTKEEIFLALLTREYKGWTKDLQKMEKVEGEDGRRTFAISSALILEKRTALLKLLSMDLNEMELNCRMEKLVEFKKVYGRMMVAFACAVKRLCEDMGDNEIDRFMYAYLPMVQGVYPYAFESDMQKAAMQQAGVSPTGKSLHELLVSGGLLLLGVKDA